MNDQPDKPKRRWLRFSLRTLFVVLTIACVWLGWKANKANQQRKAVAWIKEKGGIVLYEHQTLDGFHLEEASMPEWQRNLFGVDFLSDVDTVVFINSPAQITDASPLEPLTGLTGLRLSGTQITGLEPLANLSNLETLWIGNTPVDDLSPLAGLTKLQYLDVTGCPVSEQQVKQLQRALPNLKITGGNPDDTTK